MTADRKWLERPDFSPIPEKVKRPRKKMEFEDLLDMVRAQPKTWAVIATYKAAQQGGKKNAKRLNTNDEARVRIWLKKWRPLEHWEFHSEMVPDTWGDRTFRVRYMGLLSPADAMKLREARSAAYTARRFNGLDARQKRDERAKAKAELEMIENRVRKQAMG